MARLVAIHRSAANSRDTTPAHSRAASRAVSREVLEVEEEQAAPTQYYQPTNPHPNIASSSHLPRAEQRREVGPGWDRLVRNLTSTDSSPTSDNTTDSGQATDSSPHSRPLSALGFPHTPDDTTTCLYRMPIVGYEVLEERSRFTVFKILVLHQPTGDQWFVFRRYTDFVRLNKKLKLEFPRLRFALPSKRWFGDNFDPVFLEDRQLGLQAFIDNIIGHTAIREKKCVRDFFCLDEPPSPHDTLEESRAVCLNLEETVSDLQQQLREKNGQIAVLRSQINFLVVQQQTLVKALRLECELKGSEDEQFGSTHDLNVALLNICEKTINGSLSGARPSVDGGSGASSDGSPPRRVHPSTTMDTPLRRSLEKAFLKHTHTTTSAPTSSTSPTTAPARPQPAAEEGCR